MERAIMGKTVDSNRQLLTAPNNEGKVKAKKKWLLIECFDGNNGNFGGRKKYVCKKVQKQNWISAAFG